jgi:uncharacterized protein
MFCYFVTDLHGKHELYEKLAGEVIAGKPDALFIGGDITSASGSKINGHFFTDFLSPLFKKIKDNTGTKVFIILGNDDPAGDETYLLKMQAEGLLQYVHNRKTEFGGYKIYGYSFVPPTPFMFKDWEKYDVSRYVDPGAISPEEGYRTINVEPNKIKYGTIADDLNELTTGEELQNSIFLFHTPPYKSNLDRVANDGKKIDHVPLELHVGSIAVRRFIEKNQPLLTLHGHIHESARITGSWRDLIGSTYCFSAAHDGKELAMVKFDTGKLDEAVRVLV